jgi:hypothetical protein
MAVQPIFRSDMVIQQAIAVPRFRDRGGGTDGDGRIRGQTPSTVVGSTGRSQMDLSPIEASTSQLDDEPPVRSDVHGRAGRRGVAVQWPVEHGMGSARRRIPGLTSALPGITTFGYSS